MRWRELSPRTIGSDDGEWMIAQDAHNKRFYVKHREARDWGPSFRDARRSPGACRDAV